MMNRAEIEADKQATSTKVSSANAVGFDGALAYLLTRERVLSGERQPDPARLDALHIVASVLVLADAVRMASGEHGALFSAVENVAQVIGETAAQLTDALEQGRIAVHVNHAEDQP